MVDPTQTDNEKVAERQRDSNIRFQRSIRILDGLKKHHVHHELTDEEWRVEYDRLYEEAKQWKN